MSERALHPKQVDASTWYYEEPKGLLVVHECRGRDGQYIQTDQFTIPWRLLKRSIRSQGETDS